MSGLVQGVLTQEGRDISALINAAAAANKSEPVGLLAGFISESDLKERAARYGVWPDVSFGLGQQTVRYAGVGDHTASAANIAYCRGYYWNPENAIPEAARQYGHYYEQYQDYHEAWSRYNGGRNMAYANNPNAANIQRGWEAAQAYRVPDGEEPGMATDYVGAYWAASPNFTAGRGGHAITGIVLHGTAGPNATAWFANPASQVSAHYVIEQDGIVYQCVREQDTAWHAGVVTPNSRFAGGPNPNKFTIGIEHTRNRSNTSPITAAQQAASLALVQDLLNRYGPLEMIEHNEIDVGRICPGEPFPLAAWQALVPGGGESDGMRDSQIAIVNDEIIRNLDLALGGLDAVLATDALRDDLRTSLDNARANLALGAKPAAETLARDEG